MQKGKEKTYGPYSLPEVIITPSGGYSRDEYLRELYLSIPDDVYDRNTALFRKAIRFMQQNHDLKGEASIYSRCVNAATNRVAREFVIPVLLGSAALPIALEAGPILGATRIPILNTIRGPVWNTLRGPVWRTLKTKFFKWETGARMGANAYIQYRFYGFEKMDIVSIIAEGFTVGGSAISALIEIRPPAKENPVFTATLLNKNLTDTSIDVVANSLGAIGSKGFSQLLKNNSLLKNKNYRRLVEGVGTASYTTYQYYSRKVTDKIKEERMNNNIENEPDSRDER